MRYLFLLLTLSIGLFPLTGRGEEVRVAVSSNFLTTLRALIVEFSNGSGHRVLTSSGSTGKLYAQILHGAPFDVLLAADELRPRRLEKQGLILAGSRFTYAVGRLTLWGPNVVQRNTDCRTALLQGGFQRLALANPKTAPYGLAAKQVLEKMELWNRYQSRLVRGENIAQTLQYVISGNAQLGFVALSQALNINNGTAGCRWNIPETYHAPLEQQAVLLKTAADNPAARAFMDFLHNNTARKIIERHGYKVL